MKDLSLHILDIVQNSTRANATLVGITFDVNDESDLITIEITDNGVGMDREMVKRVIDPFVTTRTTRKVGLGIPLFLQNARQCGGSLTVDSEVGKGTTVTATFRKSNIDTPPIGDLAGVVTIIATGNPEIDFLFKCCLNNRCFVFDTREVKAILENVPINEPSMVKFIHDMLFENITDILK